MHKGGLTAKKHYRPVNLVKVDKQSIGRLQINFLYFFIQSEDYLCVSAMEAAWLL